MRDRGWATVTAEFGYMAAAFEADCEEAFAGEANPLREAMSWCPVSWAAAKALRELGVPQGFVAELCAGDLGLAGVDLHPRLERFSLGGPDRRLILAVRDERHRVVDLVALSSNCETEWALLTGDGVLLGQNLIRAAQEAVEDEYERAAIDDRKARTVRLRLHATPLAWLRAGGAGLCVLDWNRTALTWLRTLGPAVTLVVDPGARDKLKALLAYGGLPLVAEARDDGRLAA